MRKSHFALAFVTLAISSGASANDELPKRFSAKLVGQYGDIQARVVLKHQTLTYESGVTSRPLRITPTPKQWRAFRQALDEINVWQWKPNYSRVVTDTDSWTFRIEYADKAISSKGYGSWPSVEMAGDGCNASTAGPFTRLRSAIQNLLGGRPFGDPVGPLEFFPLSDLQLVATNPSASKRDQWADFRAPDDKIHRVWLYLSPCCEWTPDRLIHPTRVGAGNGVLREVTATSVSILQVCLDAQNDWYERATTMEKPRQSP